jgi:hypothetical protein
MIRFLPLTADNPDPCFCRFARFDSIDHAEMGTENSNKFNSWKNAPEDAGEKYDWIPPKISHD